MSEELNQEKRREVPRASLQSPTAVPEVQSTAPADSDQPVFVDDAYSRITKHLKENMALDGFTERGLNKLAALVDVLTSDVGKKAIDLAAERPNASAVDVPEVEAAFDFVVKSSSAERRSYLLAIAGVLLGAAIAASISIMLSATPVGNILAWQIAIGTLAVGAIIFFRMARPPRAPRRK